MNKLSPGKKDTIIEKKADRVEVMLTQLEEDIALGRLKPRERLIEDELVQQFAVTRNTVRQVLFELEKLGLVVREKNKGAFVKYFQPQEVEDLYEVRVLLELRAIELIPFPQPESLFEELDRILEIYKDGQERDDRAVVFRANILFHKTIYRTCRNPTLIEAIEQHMMKSNAIRSYNSTDPRMIDQMAGEHREMVEALRHEDLLLLKDLTIQHFSPAKDLYIRMNRP